MSRLPRLTPDELDPDQQRLYAAITGGARGEGTQWFDLTDDDGRLEGPFNAMLMAPGLGHPLQALGAALRFLGTLSARARELAILTVAAHWGSGFERRAHEAIGAGLGLSAAELAAIRDQAPLTLSDATEAVVLATVRQLLTTGGLDARSYEAAVTQLGPDGLFEVTTLVGYYGLLALQLRVFAVP